MKRRAVSHLRHPRILVGATVLSVAVAIAAGPASAGKKLSKEDRRWLEQEVGAWITRSERELFEDLETDEERATFKERFWARRDPLPETPYNEFREEVESRMRVADQIFSLLGRKGSATDMGKIFLLLGPPLDTAPDRTDDSLLPTEDPWREPETNTQRIMENEEALPAVDDRARGIDDSTGSTMVQTWIYPPNEALGIPDGLTLRFRAQSDFGYRLVRTREVDEAIERIKKHYIVSPD